MTRPGYWVLCRLAGCYAQLGRMNEAAKAAADALRLRPDFSLAKVRLREVDTAEAEHIKDGMRRAGCRSDSLRFQHQAMSENGTFRKCHLRRVKAALGSTADSSKPPESAFMSSPPRENRYRVG